MAQLAQQFTVAQQKLLNDYTTVSHLDEQIARLEIVVAFGESQQKFAPLLAERGKLEADLANSKQLVAKLSAQTKSAETDMPAAKKTLVETTAALAKVNEELKVKKDAATVAAEALASATQAAAAQPENTALADEVNKAKTLSEQLVSELTTLEKTVAENQAAVAQMAAKVATLVAAKDKAVKELAVAKPRSDALQQQHAARLDAFAVAEDALATSRDVLVTAWTEQFSVAVLQPLTPEQLAWSILYTTGQVDRQRVAAKAELDKKTPLKPEELKDAAKVAAREKQIEQQARVKLKRECGSIHQIVWQSGRSTPRRLFRDGRSSIVFR